MGIAFISGPLGSGAARQNKLMEGLGRQTFDSQRFWKFRNKVLANLVPDDSVLQACRLESSRKERDRSLMCLRGH